MKRETEKSREGRLRQEERIRLLKIYDEGDPHIDFDALEGKSLEQRFELMNAGKLPRKSKERWVEENLDEWEESRVKVPSYTVQDPNALLVEVRQKFITEAKNLRPQAFQELRKFVPHFKYLFWKISDQEFSSPLFELKHSLTDHVLSSEYGTFSEKITPDNVWQLLKHTFMLARAMTFIDIHEPKVTFTNEIKFEVERHRYALEHFNQNPSSI